MKKRKRGRKRRAWRKRRERRRSVRCEPALAADEACHVEPKHLRKNSVPGGRVVTSPTEQWARQPSSSQIAILRRRVNNLFSISPPIPLNRSLPLSSRLSPLSLTPAFISSYLISSRLTSSLSIFLISIHLSSSLFPQST